MLLKVSAYIGFVLPLLSWAQMTYEGRLTPDESRSWLYGSLAVFILIVVLVYRFESIRLWFHNFLKKK